MAVHKTCTWRSFSKVEIKSVIFVGISMSNRRLYVWLKYGNAIEAFWVQGQLPSLLHPSLGCSRLLRPPTFSEGNLSFE